MKNLDLNIRITRYALKLAAVFVFVILAGVTTRHAHAASYILCFENTSGTINSYESSTGTCAAPGTSSYTGASSITVHVGNSGLSGGETLYWENVSKTSGSYTALPTGITASPTSNCSIAGTGNTTATITVSSSLAYGTYPIYFNGGSNPSGTSCNGSLAGDSASASISVEFQSNNIFCTLTVNSEYNGTIESLPGGNTYNYTISTNNAAFGTKTITGPTSGQYNTASASSSWTATYNSGTPSGMLYLGLDSTTPNAQTCPSGGGNITYTFDFASQAATPTLTLYNTSSKSTVACGTILAVVSASGDTSWDVERDSTTIASQSSSTNITDTSVGSTSHVYQARGYNQYSSTPSAWVTGTPSSITATPCGSPTLQVYNTSSKSTVACGTVLAVITPATGDVSWDLERDSTVINSKATSTSITDTGAGETAHTYYVRGYDQYGNVYSWNASTPSSITATPCSPPSLQVYNTNTNNAVACGNILAVVAPATGDVSWDVERDGTILSNANNVTTTNITDTPTAAAHVYEVRGHDAYGNIYSWNPGSPASITPTPCAPNFSATSGMELYEVNGAAYPFTSQCIASQTGTPTPMNAGDTVTFRIDACNSGTIAATSVTVTDTVDANVTSTKNYKVNGSTVTPTISGKQITFSLGTINAGSQPYITFDGTLLGPPGDGCSNATPSPKFCNNATINYKYTNSSGTQSGSYTIPQIGPFVYNYTAAPGGGGTTGSTGPNQKEIQP